MKPYLWCSCLILSCTMGMIRGFVVRPTKLARVKQPPCYASSGLQMVTKYRVQRVKTDADVLNVASFRNGLRSPSMMVAQQQYKKDNMDNNQAALYGLLVGLGILGPIFGGLSYSQNGDVQQALGTYAVIGGISGGLAAFNNLAGGRVYVMTEAEATNRILVDYAENLKRKADVGFTAISQDEKYKCVGGVMAAADVQLRNSQQSPQYALKVSKLPSHLHLRNMQVDEDMRRQGVARALVNAIVTYAKQETDAQFVTLEVEEKNKAAINLYESEGFQVENSQKSMLGRQFMMKEI